jgi:hypothetical protein
MLNMLIAMFVTLCGIALMVLGKWFFGILFLLGGIAVMACIYTTMMRGRGQDPEQGLYNGLNGQGKQQSETVDAKMPEPGEQSPDIWEKMEK